MERKRKEEEAIPCRDVQCYLVESEFARHVRPGYVLDMADEPDTPDRHFAGSVTANAPETLAGCLHTSQCTPQVRGLDFVTIALFDRRGDRGDQ